MPLGAILTVGSEVFAEVVCQLANTAKLIEKVFTKSTPVNVKIRFFCLNFDNYTALYD